MKNCCQLFSSLFTLAAKEEEEVEEETGSVSVQKFLPSTESERVRE
jgi:hypothetical protein